MYDGVRVHIDETDLLKTEISVHFNDLCDKARLNEKEQRVM